MQSKRGRPPKFESGPMRQAAFWIDAERMEALRKEAELRKISVSELLRRLIDTMRNYSA